MKQLTIEKAIAAANRKNRHENDLYETPGKLTKAMLERVSPQGTCLECCAGNRSMVRSLQKNGDFSHVWESDLTWKTEAPKDATTPEFWQYWQDQTDNNISWVITNPPFNAAPQIVPLAFENCKVGVAFLLRSTYSEPCKNRADWLIANSDCLRYRFDINPRPKFRAESGTDTATVTWYVYLKNWSWTELGMRSPFGYITEWRK